MKLDGLKDFVTSATGKLAASYLVVILGMSLGFSLVLYSTSVAQLQRQLPPQELTQGSIQNQGTGMGGDAFQGELIERPRVREFLEQRIAESRRTLIGRLVILNMLTFVSGAVLSYFLARRTLKPIEDNMEAQSQFVSDASHELRTPLTSIQTSNEVALRDTTLTLAQSKRLLHENIQEVAKLQSLTDGLLKLAKNDGTPLDTKQLLLQDAVSDAINQVMSLAQAKSMTIEDEVPPLKALADRQSLSQALVLLLDNAIKYSPEATVIRIQAAKKGKQVQLKVLDQGPGIRPYDLRRIFDRFYRADQSRSGRHVAGTGIGLSLAQKLVARQSGELTAYSVIGKGSTFTISLPAA